MIRRRVAAVHSAPSNRHAGCCRAWPGSDQKQPQQEVLATAHLVGSHHRRLHLLAQVRHRRRLAAAGLQLLALVLQQLRRRERKNKAAHRCEPGVWLNSRQRWASSRACSGRSPIGCKCKHSCAPTLRPPPAQRPSAGRYPAPQPARRPAQAAAAHSAPPAAPGRPARPPEQRTAPPGGAAARPQPAAPPAAPCQKGRAALCELLAPSRLQRGRQALAGMQATPALQGHGLSICLSRWPTRQPASLT